LGLFPLPPPTQILEAYSFINLQECFDDAVREKGGQTQLCHHAAFPSSLFAVAAAIILHLLSFLYSAPLTLLLLL